MGGRGPTEGPGSARIQTRSCNPQTLLRVVSIRPAPPPLIQLRIVSLMSGLAEQNEWYYVGQYGELGPLSLPQMQDLIQDKVIDSDTYVWRQGMTDWMQAGHIAELRSRIVVEMKTPPPPPQRPAIPQAPVQGSAPPMQAFSPVYPQPLYDQSLRMNAMSPMSWSQMEQSLPRSDKSRVTAGLLNFIPGAGRFYLGYTAHGVLQLVTFLLCGVGIIWSAIDAVYILMGGVKYDGYGRVLQD